MRSLSVDWGNLVTKPSVARIIFLSNKLGSLLQVSTSAVVTPGLTSVFECLDTGQHYTDRLIIIAIRQYYRDIIYYQYVNLPALYASQVLDRNHTGLISIHQIAKDPLLLKSYHSQFPKPIIRKP